MDFTPKVEVRDKVIFVHACVDGTVVSKNAVVVHKPRNSILVTGRKSFTPPGVNWFSCGTQDSTFTRAFAEALLVGSELCARLQEDKEDD